MGPLTVMVCLCVSAMLAVGAEETASAGGITVKVLGQSGKIQLTLKDNKTITVEMDSMTVLFQSLLSLQITLINLFAVPS